MRKDVETVDRPRRRARPFHRVGQLWLAQFYLALQLGSYGALGYFLVEFLRSGDKDDGVWVVGSVVGVVVVGTIRLVQAHKVSCPLCHGHILARKRCRMHRDARRYWPLSHGVSAQIDMLLRRWFNCPFCGTAFRMKR